MSNKNSSFVVIVLSLCVGSAITAVFFSLNQRIAPAPIIIELPTPLPAIPTATAEPIRVFINGEVKNPALYELPANSVLQEAIDKAGGFKEEANTAVINLAQPLQDGMQIYVPSVLETAVSPVILDPQPLAPQSEEATGLIDINVASADELDQLPGIGPSIAQNIIAFREANGPFLIIDDLLLVSGIGEAKFEQIEALITVGE